MSRIRLLFIDKAAYTLFEIIIVLILIGIVSGGIISIFTSSEPYYELIAEANNIKSTVRLLQAKSMQYFEQHLYVNTVMRDDDLWGVQILAGKPLKIVRKPFESKRIENVDIKGPVWLDRDIYPSYKHKITYSLTNKCLDNNEIFFDALGKPVNRTGEQCKSDIEILLSMPDTKKKVKILINKTGHVSIQSHEEEDI